MMNSRSRLDYALFQLTPTRTRCDLVICTGDCKEKLASGLLEPFIAHLKSAKDQISKGGYSITLSAPASASWFTKSTLERFVRFVSTPEVLERFITIEREIVNIDSSVNTNASSDSQIYGLDEHLNKSAAFAYKHEDKTSDALHEEDSKVHLQRVLETRKAVLQREQAMVYARALVAGFETDNLQDLIYFADAFGSPRLREACSNFMELCNTKSNDRIWMDEVAAMQAYSRSQYSYMEDDLGQELRINVQNGNFATKKHNLSIDGSHLHQYMRTYEAGPMFHPPYQGYPFPYYQGNHPWPPNMEDSRSRGKRSHKIGSQELTKDGNFDSSDSSSGSDSGSYNRSSSQKVIIRNINYITSARDEESEHESDANQNLDGTIEDKHEGQKVMQQWDIFQNLLMKDLDDKESKEKYVSHKFEDPNIIPSGNRPEFATKSGKHEEKDWFLRSLQDKEIQEKSRDIFEDHIKSVESTKDVLVRDPLVVQARSLNEYSDSQLKTHDVLMVSVSNLTQKKEESTCFNEPNDLYMVFERDTAGKQDVPAWTPEMESGYTNNDNDTIVKLDSPEANKSTVEKGLERKGSTIEAKSKALVGSRSKKSTATKTTIPKGKLEKEEERKRKMEELLTQRQKRIAERRASTSKTANNHKPKTQQTTNNYKPKDQLASQDMKKSNKTVIRSSTIDRLSAARVVNPAESKPGNKLMKATVKKNGEPKPGNRPTNLTNKENGVSRTLLSHKTAGAENKKVKPDKVKTLDKNIVSKNLNRPKKKIVDHKNAKQLPNASQIKKIGNGVARIGLSTPAQSDKTKSVSETLHKASLVLQKKDVTLLDSKGGSANKAINSVSFKINEDIKGAKKNPIAHEIPVMEILTPPPVKANPERSSSRKKWSNLETSSKALSGFKKLLSFGRRS